MYDFSDLQPTNKEMAALILGVFVFLAAVFGAGYMLGISNAGKPAGTDVSDNGNGTAVIGNQLTEAGSNIQHAKDGIEAAAGTADKIGTGISQAKESAGYIQHTADSSAELIAECQQIIGRVRSRREKDQATH